MTELFAWIVFPLLLLGVSSGAGLLVVRLAGVAVPASLVPPLGFAAAIVAVGPVYALGGGWVPALGVLVAVVGAGFVLGRERIGELRPGAGAAAGAAVYGLYMAPVVLTGEATFLGYNVLNDTAIHLLLVDHLAEHGDKMIDLQRSTVSVALDEYVGKSYPVGSHELLATLNGALGAEAARLYQPFLALTAALAASSLVAVVRGLGVARAVAVVAAATALGGQLLFSFNLQGGIKELGFVAALAMLAALGAELFKGERPERVAALAAVPAAAAYAIYGLSALAWLGPLALVAAAWLGFSRGRRRLLPAAVAATAAFCLLALPAIPGSIEFYREGKGDLTSEKETGPLASSIQPIQTTGIWLKGDYRRLPDKGGRWSYALGAFALVLAILGLGLVLRRRAAGPLLFLLPALVAWLAVSQESSPYIDAKLLAVLSPAVLLMSCLGVVALWWASRRPEAILAGLLLVGAVAFSDALAYRQAAPAPIDRLVELGEIGERFETGEPLLLNEFEDYGKRFLAHSRVIVPYDIFTKNAQPRPGLRRPGPKSGEQWRPPVYTLDELTWEFVTAFPWIVIRRSPAEARPPGGYERRFAGRFYEVWERVREPARRHVPGGTPPGQPWDATGGIGCPRLIALGKRSPLLAALRSPTVLFDVAAHRPLPIGWKRGPARVPHSLEAPFGGVVRATATTAGGPHTVWVRGRTYRDDEITIDGRRVGVARGDNGPDQWIEAGSIELDAGPHTLELRRPRRSLAPGDGRPDLLGPVVAVPDRPAELGKVTRGHGADLCGKPVDWVEQP